ncbi:hypothetical protein P691DRAFT_765677 [Macrolepiota fuliginosa MF-IS2]|uniref:Uncharacterized protein n=1 Tax=Macrolepiota fuliginosa MF-IS2 TaxID=1400762 RepID=A0A9P6BXS9_9AGAR|nr:hypothetical protein P691DRAFT_765677 [Macrolepiota fuliginosa MF-IS2]
MFKLSALISTVLLVGLSNFGSPSVASPLSIIKRDSKIVFSPHITYPDSAAIWLMGSVQNVTWDTADLPNEKRKATGIVLLGYLENGSEHLDIKSPLATGFPMDMGSVSIRVPARLKERNDYICVVFGDSGNISEQFKITKSH